MQRPGNFEDGLDEDLSSSGPEYAGGHDDARHDDAGWEVREPLFATESSEPTFEGDWSNPSPLKYETPTNASWFTTTMSSPSVTPTRLFEN